MLVGTILVALAVMKPWTLGAASGPAGEPAVNLGAAPSERPTAPASAPIPMPEATGTWDPNAMACMSSEGNRILALTREPGVEVRTWLTVDNLSLTSPLDPAIVPLRLLSSSVVGLGVCARRVNQDATLSSAASIVEVARIGGQPSTATGVGSPGLLDLGVPPIITVQLGDPTMGVLYGPPAGPPAPGVAGQRSPSPSPELSAGQSPSWPVGDYAIEFALPGDPAGRIRWLRLDIVPAVGQYG